MTAIASTRFFSADSHVVEPRDLWTKSLERRFRDRAPRLESRSEGDYYIVDQLPPFPVGLEGAVLDAKVAGRIDRPDGYRYEDARPGCWDPYARLADQDLDHLSAEVIYPGPFGMNFCYVTDAEYERACVRVYNDWIADFCTVAPSRLIGAALLPSVGPVDWAIEEAERAAGLGLATLCLRAEIPERPYSLAQYDPLWSALNALGLPIALHCGTGEPLWQKLKRQGLGTGVLDNKIGVPMRALSEIIWAGIPARHPSLKFVLVEGGIGWIASALRFMDHWWEDHRRWMGVDLPEAPSTYFSGQFWATFEDDRAGLLTRDLLNIEHLMWGSDYPHTEGTFPRSELQVSRDFAGVPESELRMLVSENAAGLYGRKGRLKPAA